MDVAANLTERIRYLQEWTPPSQRQKLLERARSPFTRRLKDMSEVHVRSSLSTSSEQRQKSLGEFFASVPSLKEEITGLKKKVETLISENSALRKSKREADDNLAMTKLELTEAEAKLADSDFFAAESRSKMAALDHDVEKLCDLSKLLSEENASLQVQLQERDKELTSLKAENEALLSEVQKLKENEAFVQKCLDDKKEEVERTGGEICAMKKLVDELRMDREALHDVKEEIRVEKEMLHGEKEGLQAEVIKVLMQAKEERERLQRAETAASEAAAKAATEAARAAEMAKHVAELEEAVMEYEGDLKHLSEDVERATAEAAAARERAAKIEVEMERERQQQVARAAVLSTPLEDVDIAQLSKQLSSIIFYRESSTDADRLVQAEFQKMTAAFSQGLLRLEAKIGEWKERMSKLEDALAAAADSATSSQHTAAHLISEFSAVSNVLKRPAAGPAPPPPPPPRRRVSTTNIVPATAALAGGIYAIKLLRARSLG